MRIETICENRKELVKAMAEILGEPSKYLGPPSFGYQIGGAIVDRDGNIETEDGEMLQKELQRRGFIENNQEELNLQIPIEGHTAESIRNLIFMIHSKQYLLKRAVGTEVLHMSERLIERLSEEKDADMNRVMEIFEEEKVHCFGLEFVADKIVFNGFPMEAESTISFAELTCMMAERAKEMKWINPAETIEANAWRLLTGTIYTKRENVGLSRRFHSLFFTKSGVWEKSFGCKNYSGPYGENHGFDSTWSKN